MEEKKKKINKKLTILIVTLILAALCLFGYLACNKIKNGNAKQKFFNAIDKLNTKLAKEKQEDIKTFSGDYTVTMDVASRFIDEEIQEIINKFKLNLKIDVDNENESFNFNLNSTYDGDNLLKGKITNQNNNLYVFLDDIYSKWIKIESNEKINTDSLLTTEDYEVLEKELEKALNHALKSNYFTKEKDNDLNKYTLSIDKNNMEVIIYDILNYLETSKDFIKVYEKAFNNKFSDVAENIMANVKSYITTESLLISIYADNDNNTKSISFVTVEGNEKNEISIEVGDVNEIKVVFYNNDIAIISGEIKQSTENNNKVFEIRLSMAGILTAKIKVVGNHKYNEKITLPTITDSIDSNDLTEEDINNIYMNLFNNKYLINIIELVQDYMEKEEI